MPTLVRWEPLRELGQLQGEVSRLFNGLLESPTRTSQGWIPPLDLWETESELVYAFDLPGLSEDQIQIEVQDDTLTVSGERVRETEEHGDRFFRFERRYGSFARAVGLPTGVDEAKIAASYVNGVLEVRVRKPEEAKPRRIHVGAGHGVIENTSNSSDT